MVIIVNPRQNNDQEKSKEPSKWLTLKERKDVKYSFTDEDVDEIFDSLLQANALTLPKLKRHGEINRTDDPKYCRYHRIVSHPSKDCYVLKNIINGMVRMNQISLVEPSARWKTTTSNNVSLTKEAISVAFER